MCPSLNQNRQRVVYSVDLDASTPVESNPPGSEHHTQPLAQQLKHHSLSMALFTTVARWISVTIVEDRERLSISCLVRFHRL